MARVIVTDASAFLPGVAPRENAATRGLWTRKDELADQASKLAIARDRVRLEEDKDSSTAIKGRYDVLSSALNMGDQRGAAVEALMERGRGMRPVPAKMMPMAGDGAAVDIAAIAPGASMFEDALAAREMGESDRARERFEAARASRDEESMDARELATRSLMPTPAAPAATPPVRAPGPTEPAAPSAAPASPVLGRDTAAPATPAVTTVDPFAALGLPSADRKDRRYTTYTDRDLADQVSEIAAAAARTPEGTFDVAKVTKLRKEIARRPNRALIEQFITESATRTPEPAGYDSESRGRSMATGPTAPGAVDPTTGERAADISRGGVTIQQFGRLGSDVVTPGAGKAEAALFTEVPAAKERRMAAMEADLAEDGVIGGMLKAAQQSLAGGNGFETSLDRIARTGRAPTMPEIVALSRQAYTPEDQEYVVQLALESGLVRGRTLAEQRDPVAMYSRVLPLLKFPERPKKSELEVYGDVLRDAGNYIRSRYGNDTDMFKALAKGMYDAGIIDIKQAQEATREFGEANKPGPKGMAALRPPGKGITISVTGSTNQSQPPPSALDKDLDVKAKQAAEANQEIDDAQKALDAAKAARAGVVGAPSGPAARAADQAIADATARLSKANSGYAKALAAYSKAFETALKRQQLGTFTTGTKKPGPAVGPDERKQQIQSRMRELKGLIGTPEQREAMKTRDPAQYRKLMTEADTLKKELARLP